MSLFFSSAPSREGRPGILHLVKELLTEVTELVQQHVELAKTEAKVESQRLVKIGVFGLLSVILLQVMLIYLGSLLVLFFLTQARMGIVEATIYTFWIFLLVSLIFITLAIQQVWFVRRDLKLLKNPKAK